MEGALNQEPLDCPFCHFSSQSHGELVFHVEDVHSEAIRSSSYTCEEVNENSPMLKAGAKDKNSDFAITKDPEFIECQCGEYCLVAECESHLEMHYAEGVSFDETQSDLSDSAGLEASFYDGKASSLSMEGRLTSQSSDALSYSRPSMSTESPAARKSRSEGRKNQSFVQEFMDVLRNSTVEQSAKPPKPEFYKGPKRLGVSTVDSCKNL